MKKFFAITCHKPSVTLELTVNYLSSFEDNFILIHVDNKVSIKEFKKLEKANVVLLNKRLDVFWGDISQIEATLLLMRFFLNHVDRYEYFFLLSGDDIPLMSNEQMDLILNCNVGSSYIHYQDGRNNFIDPKSRVMYRFPKVFFNRNKMFLDKVWYNILINFKFLFKKNKVPEIISTVPLYKGTNWFTLTRSDCNFIIEFVDNKQDFLPFFRKSLCADEVFFHTILKMKKDLVIFSNKELLNDCLRYIDWDSGPEYPRVLDRSDISKIPTGTYFFGRKVNENDAPYFIQHFIGL